MHSVGTVIFISRNQGMVVVQHDNGFSVVELLGGEGELEAGDRVSGDWDALGGKTIRASRLQRNMGVYMQGSWVPVTMLFALRETQAAVNCFLPKRKKPATASPGGLDTLRVLAGIFLALPDLGVKSY